MTVAVAREGRARASCGAEAGRCRDAGGVGACSPWRWCWRGARARPRRGRPAWTGNPPGLRESLRRGGASRVSPPAPPGAEAAADARQAAELEASSNRGRTRPGRRGALAAGRPAGLIEAASGPVDERSVGKVLRRLGFARLSVRPRPRADEAAQEASKKASPSWSRQRSRARAGKPVEVWFQDEARVGQQGTLTRVWARRGSRPRAPRDRRHAWADLFGAVCPERAIGAALVLPSRYGATGLHLPRSAATSRPARTPWSCSTGRAGTRRWPRRPENLTLLPLPRYSPS